ncbi:hypothetical protein DPX16_9532 [Anabarilius grahami]|uniref:Uncharacterized protein n=1 Tax=Anabarilius grahami TaxID=495550 RepID=A0A3N0Z6B9_ANAGA|nr:hypothetical protein DPX16_9532 [Anabarilius grahami]
MSYDKTRSASLVALRVTLSPLVAGRGPFGAPCPHSLEETTLSAEVWISEALSGLFRSSRLWKTFLRLPVMIEQAVGRAVSTETGTINRNMDNIMEKLTALQRQLDRFGNQNGLRE